VKAQHIAVFNTEHLSSMFERVIIASGTSNRQTKALAASVRDSVRGQGFQVMSTEGEDNGEWIIVDCGAAVAHIMQPAIREYYHLEEIWGGKAVKMKMGAVKAGLVKASEPDEDEAPARKPARKAAGTAAAPAKKAAKAAPKKAPGKAAPAKASTAPRKAASKTAGKAPVKTIVAPQPKSAAKKTAAKTVAKKAANKSAAYQRVGARRPSAKTAGGAAAPAARKAPARKKSA
jgi:ribosome-associated protein